MHPVKHMHLTGLVLVLEMTVIEVLLEVEHDLTIFWFIHHDDSGGHTVPGQRVLTLQLDIASGSSRLSSCQECCPVLVSHRAGAPANHLHSSGEGSRLGVTVLPGERGHEGLTDGEGHFEDESIVWSMGLDGHACTTNKALEGHRISLLRWAVRCQQSLHLFWVRRHLTVIGFKNLLKLSCCFLF